MRLRWIIVSIVALAAAGGAILAVRAHKPKPAPIAAAPPPPAEANLIGQVEPRTTVTAPAPIAGIIDAFFLDVNQEVYKDQLLGRIRNPEADLAIAQTQAKLDQAQARVTSLNTDQLAAKLEISRAEADQSRARGELDRLQKDYQREKGLWDVGATPRLVFEKAEKDYEDAQQSVAVIDANAKNAHTHADRISADLESANRAVIDANAALDLAKAQQNKGEIHSPADGIVFTRHGQPGEMIEQNASVFEIATGLTQLQVRVASAPQIRAGQAALIHVPELSPDEIAGTVREIRGDQAFIDFTSPVALAKLGMTAQVKIKF